VLFWFCFGWGLQLLRCGCTQGISFSAADDERCTCVNSDWTTGLRKAEGESWASGLRSARTQVPVPAQL
jgi:hypothetical protein